MSDKTFQEYIEDKIAMTITIQIIANLLSDNDKKIYHREIAQQIFGMMIEEGLTK